jgi:hypothetical protein
VSKKQSAVKELLTGIAMGESSLERITKADLRRLAHITADERDDFFSRHAEWKLLYARRLLCTALCGQSALHFCNGTAGIEEFEVWSFYAAHAEAPFPHHRHSYRDFGKPKFGRATGSDAYAGRRIRLTGRSIPYRPGDDPAVSLQHYLRSGRTQSARQLRDSAVVLIEPDSHLAYVAWPTLVS